MDAAYRAATMITANVAAHTVQGYTAQHMVAAAHEKTIRMLCDELNVLQGYGQTPARGTLHEMLLLDETEVLVEYEVQPEEGDGWNEPHYPEEINVLRAFINGHWIEADVFSQTVIDRRLDAIRERRDEQAQVAADDAAEARARDRMEYAA